MSCKQSFEYFINVIVQLIRWLVHSFRIQHFISSSFESLLRKQKQKQQQQPKRITQFFLHCDTIRRIFFFHLFVLYFCICLLSGFPSSVFHINSICHLPMNNSDFLYFLIVVLTIFFLLLLLLAGVLLLCTHIHKHRVLRMGHSEWANFCIVSRLRGRKWVLTRKKTTQHASKKCNNRHSKQSNVEIWTNKPDSKIDGFDLLFK